MDRAKGAKGMRITDLRLTEVQGYLAFAGEFWEERLVQPIDVYPDRRDRGPDWLPRDANGQYVVSQVFLEVLTDDEVVGLAGPIDVDQAFLIYRHLKHLVIDQDPLAG